MANQRAPQPISTVAAVKKMETGQFLLPGIQRSFVWKPDQICNLFDSIVRGYPIGSILLWRVSPTGKRNLGFRRFEQHVEPGFLQSKMASTPPGGSVTAVLDGQQRLTALLVGLTGTYQLRGEPYRLYIDLDSEHPEATATEMRYGFRFLSAKMARSLDHAIQLRDVYDLTTEVKLNAYCQRHGIRGQRKNQMRAIQRAIHHNHVVVLSEERTDDLDRVLGIFARINTGGTTLSYADLLLSVATATWDTSNDRNAFVMVRELRDSLNAVGEGFNFSDDRMIKAGLVLIGLDDPKFTASTFRTQVGKRVEAEWPEIDRALRVAVELLAEFGLSSRSLAAQNALIPVASYAYVRGLRPSYVHAAKHESDRRLVRAFVARTLLLPAFWTGAVDPVLVQSHKTIKRFGAAGFPLAELELELAGRGKSIALGDEDLDELLDTTYGKPKAFLLLRLLYPNVHEKEKLHKDHVFPRKVFEASQRKKYRLNVLATDHWVALADRLPNLQLLEASDNSGDKKAKLPSEWLATLAERGQKAKYMKQDLSKLPQDFADFEDFFELRRDLMFERLVELLQL